MDNEMMIERIIGNVVDNSSKDETSIRRAMRMVLPSWKQSDSSYGPFNRRGFRKVAFQIYKEEKRLDVEWYEYDSYWNYFEKGGEAANYYN